ncbi:MAG: DoxX family protein, partial [Balneolaceae bacterium]|nr:DoxX family protein [Balneolaceae bacterium]
MNSNFISILPTEPFRQKLEDVGKLLLRLLFGLSLALNHGWPTFRGAWNGVTDFPDPLGIGANLSMWLAGSAEFGCALLVVFGLLTRFAAIPVLLNFVVAFFIFHA